MNEVHQDQNAARGAPGEGEKIQVDHPTLKNLVEIQVHLLIKGKEEGTLGIALEMSLGKLNILHLMVRQRWGKKLRIGFFKIK